MPDDWEIVEASGTTFDELDQLGSQNVTWILTVPENTSGDRELTATVTYSDGVQDPVEFTVSATVNVFSEQEGQAFWTAADYWIYVRGRNEDDPEGLSMARADHIITDTQANRLSHYLDGEYDSIDVTDQVAGTGELYHVRARYEGDTLQGKWWLAGEDEPDEWQLEVDPGIDDPGFVGAGHWEGSPYHIYEYGVGIGGNEAP